MPRDSATKRDDSHIDANRPSCSSLSVVIRIITVGLEKRADASVPGPYFLLIAILTALVTDVAATVSGV